MKEVKERRKDANNGANISYQNMRKFEGKSLRKISEKFVLNNDRRACGYKDNYIDIGISPVTGILNGYE